MDDLLDVIQANAARVRKYFLEQAGVEIGFDVESVLYVDGHIEQLRERGVGDPEMVAQLANTFGAWLGECVIVKSGGAWVQGEYGPEIRRDDVVCYPFEAIQRHFENGTKNSILSFYALATTMSGPAQIIAGGLALTAGSNDSEGRPGDIQTDDGEETAFVLQDEDFENLEDLPISAADDRPAIEPNDAVWLLETNDPKPSRRHLEITADMVKRGEIAVGRLAACDLCLDDETVKPRHAYLMPIEYGFEVVDDVGNGTFIQIAGRWQQAGHPAPILYDGYSVAFGDIAFTLRRIAPDAGGTWLLQGADGTGRALRFDLVQIMREGWPLKIGSIDSNALQVQDRSVGAHHAGLAPVPNGYLLENRARGKPTLVNGERLEPKAERQISDGDVISLGDVSLTLRQYT